MLQSKNKSINELEYLDILKINQELECSSAPKFEVAILSNVMANQFKDILELKLKFLNLSPKVEVGDYDNILQDSVIYSKSDVVFILWELVNVIDGFQYKAEVLGDEKIESLKNKIKEELNFLFGNLKKTRMVIFNKFNVSAFTCGSIVNFKLQDICDELNDFLSSHLPDNFQLIDLDKIFLKNGVNDCVDYRYFSSSKSLYNVNFYKNYVELVTPIIRSVIGATKKVLILDCDNTLWKGILGEDGIDGLKLGGEHGVGLVFSEIQSLAKSLAQNGVLVAIASKNNQDDVIEVFNNHQEMILQEEDLVGKRVNWQDKASNIRSLLKELNVGVDSAVFVDDSAFEIDLVAENISEVLCLQVPNSLYDYPFMFRQLMAMFYDPVQSSEDLKRHEMYRQEQKRTEEYSQYSNMEDYLESLCLAVTIKVDDAGNVPRFAQMTQRTNQFNLTTKRYTTAEINQFVENPDFVVFSLSLNDKFGDYGITALAIVELEKEQKSAKIDTFLMSCRIIGREVESVFFSEIVSVLKNKGIESVFAKYMASKKNMQVEMFYENSGMELLNADEEIREYRMKMSSFKPKKLEHIFSIY